MVSEFKVSFVCVVNSTQILDHPEDPVSKQQQQNPISEPTSQPNQKQHQQQHSAGIGMCLPGLFLLFNSASFLIQPRPTEDSGSEPS